MIYINDLLNFIQEVDKKLKEEITLVAVGGTAMTLLGLKESTKDVDFCAETKEDMDSFLKLTKNSKFKIDIWYDGYIFALQLPKDYVKQAKVYKKYNKIELRVLDPMDIILTKTARLNQRDFEDIQTLTNRIKINKDKLIERFNQIKDSIPGSEAQYEQNFELILSEFI